MSDHLVLRLTDFDGSGQDSDLPVISGEVETTMDEMCRSFSFEVVEDPALLAGKQISDLSGAPCQIFIGDTLILTGFIESVDIAGDAGNRTISIEGRDKTADILDSDIDGTVEFVKSTVTLLTVAQTVLANIFNPRKSSDGSSAGSDPTKYDKFERAQAAEFLRRGYSAPTVVDIDKNNEEAIAEQLGIEDLELIRSVIGTFIEPFEDASDNISSEPGDNAFDFLTKWSARRQVLLSSDEEGNLLFIKPAAAAKGVDDFSLHSVKTTKSIILLNGGAENNVLAYSRRDNHDSLYYYYVVTGFRDAAKDDDRSSLTTNADLVENSALYSPSLLHSLYRLTETEPGPFEGPQRQKPFLETEATPDVPDIGRAFVSGRSPRRGRTKYIVADTAMSQKEAVTMARFNYNKDLADSLQLSYTVQGYRAQDGKLWRKNELVSVQDEVGEVAGVGRVRSVIFSTGPGGSVTTLSIVHPLSYVSEVELQGS